MGHASVRSVLAALLALAVSASAQVSGSGPAIARIAEQFDVHPLVMMGELHRYAELHAFMREMLRDPRFICRADDVVVEFGNSRLQAVADEYAFGGNVTETRLQRVWRETVVPFTWNSPVYRQFFETIRDVNEKRLCPHPIRIVLGDPPLDWSKIRTKKDYEPFADRDGHLANVVEQEVLAKHHRAFLLVGKFHALKQAPGGAEGAPEGPTAAQIIERRHPGSLFCIVPVPSAAAAEAMQMGQPPSFKLVRESELQNMDFGILGAGASATRLGDVVDGVLYLGEKHTSSYPPPTIYLDPGYLQELRRRVSIIKDYNGQDFISVLDGLVKEGKKLKKQERRRARQRDSLPAHEPLAR